MKLHLRFVLCFLVAGAACLPLAGAPRPSAGEQFFIISSVDATKHQLLLKKPTEVTELVLIAAKTVCLDEAGKQIDFKTLRSGDTVYVTTVQEPDGVPAAIRIRKAPMTVEELHRRYLSGS